MSAFSSGLVWAHSSSCIQLAEMEGPRWTRTSGGLGASFQLGALIVFQDSSHPPSIH